MHNIVPSNSFRTKKGLYRIAFDLDQNRYIILNLLNLEIKYPYSSKHFTQIFELVRDLERAGLL